ncbi:IclR family transcriptional regulator [Agrococcus sp. Marseille-Q4369]|uniref:IclR family transcriptional regulator n=1 Tax=Agrococcus sp. Marseille-Q4369 TaxID=2810513 RepID=UPI001B8D3690|nr:IclR family transcriptional regulator [Agrococcus sp. Marseille-Q4369]QUW17827.1 IclR family transcriptional regulator [Agrococcus sp. Marseille-Q4369]
MSTDLDDVSQSGESTGGSRLLLRGLSILTCLSEHPEGLTLQQIHETLRIPIGTCHRILSALHEHDFVARSEVTRRFELGAATRRLGGSSEITKSAPAALTTAADETGETAFLAALRGDAVECVSLVESKHNLRLFVKRGQQLPLHAAASARTLLAYAKPKLVERLLSSLSMTSFTPGTIRDVNKLIDHLAEIRERGFDVCDSELDRNVWAVAAPVYGFDNSVQWALTVAAAESRVRSVDTRVAITQSALSAARSMSRAMGFEGELRTRPDEQYLQAFHEASLVRAG